MTTTRGTKKKLSVAAAGVLATAGMLTAPAAGISVQHSAEAGAARAGAVARGTRLVASGASTAGFTRMTTIATSARSYPSYSSNWSGIGGVSPSNIVRGARGIWSVPKVTTVRAARYASTWVGVDGIGNTNLIQTGTDEDSLNGRAFYAAWIEILPAASQVIGNSHGRAPVKPGDVIRAEVNVVRYHRWQIRIEDVTQRWYFQRTLTYTGAGHSAEWIEEAPTVNGQQSRIADFGHVAISQTALYVKRAGKLGWYSTSLTAGAEIVLRQQGVTYAVPTAPLPRGGSRSGQHFTVRYR